MNKDRELELLNYKLKDKRRTAANKNLKEFILIYANILVCVFGVLGFALGSLFSLAEYYTSQSNIFTLIFITNFMGMMVCSHKYFKLFEKNKDE